MTDTELQTLIRNACKAARWRFKRFVANMGADVWIDDMPVVVRLADDDGDSRMLQVACRIDLEFTQVNRVWCAECHSPWLEDGFSKYANEEIGNDANKSARMAVLRCAGMIGEAME